MGADDRKHTEESRKRMRSRERDRELEKLIEEYAIKAEKRTRPVQIKTFEV